MIPLLNIRGVRIVLNPQLIALMLALLGFTLAVPLLKGRDLSSMHVSEWSALILLSGFLLSMSLHELGHAVMARIAGVPQVKVVLSVVGRTRFIDHEMVQAASEHAQSAESKAESAAAPKAEPDTDAELPAAAIGTTARPWSHYESLIAFAGPAVNLLLFALLLPWVTAASGRELLRFVVTPDNTSIGNLSSLAGIAAWLGWVNLAMALINLLPLLPLDGSRVLLGVARLFGKRKAGSRILILSSLAMGLLGLGVAAWGLVLAHGKPSIALVLALMLGIWGLLGSFTEWRRLRE